MPQPLRRIAQDAVQLAGEVGEFTLPDLLGRIEDVETSRCAVLLQAAGERRGNYAAAIAGAVARLQQEVRRRQEHGLRQTWKPQRESSDELDSGVRALADALRQRRHFLPSKGVAGRGFVKPPAVGE